MPTRPRHASAGKPTFEATGWPRCPSAGLTQAELAEALGLSQASASKIEHGKISGIDVVRA